MLKIYSILVSILGYVILPLIFVIRIFQKKDVSSWPIKFGKIELPLNFDKTKQTILVHGVSVGEVNSLEKLLHRIKKEFPNCNLIVTTGTKTGQETAIKKYGEKIADFTTYFPFDIPHAVKKFLNTIEPDIILITETEIWPIFAFECSLRKIPLYIINGRMSDESFRAYKFLSPFFKKVLPLYKGIFTQSQTDKARLIKAGADENLVEVMKNLKFDIEKFEPEIKLKTDNSRILIAGSTHRGEDIIVLETYGALKKEHKDLKLLLAPRHITRIKEVKELIERMGFNYALYSENPDFNKSGIILLDVLGELSGLYSVCSAAFIGGSFNNTGGHNPLEAIIFNKPVVSGPSVKNFRDIYAILSEAKAGKVVKTKEEMFLYLNKLFSDKDFYDETAKNCQSVFENQQGAIDFVIRKLKDSIK